MMVSPSQTRECVTHSLSTTFRGTRVLLRDSTLGLEDIAPPAPLTMADRWARPRSYIVSEDRTPFTISGRVPNTWAMGGNGVEYNFPRLKTFCFAFVQK